MNLTISSSAFSEGEMIPAKYTCKGQDISPPLSWSGIPARTKSIAIISDDPDAPAGTWVHWVVFNIPHDISELKEGVPRSKSFNNGIKQGINDFRKIGYGGPCPPGGTHRYYFKIYALDIVLIEPPGITKKQLLDVIQGHIIAKGELMGTFKK